MHYKSWKMYSKNVLKKSKLLKVQKITSIFILYTRKYLSGWLKIRKQCLNSIYKAAV